MQAELKQVVTASEKAADGSPVVVIGAGPVGVRAALEVLRMDPQRRVVMFGAEAWRPYNRVQLSSYLAGDVSQEEIEEDVAGFTESGRLNFIVDPVVAIDRFARTVTTSSGHQQSYQSLILATGSAPHVPAIPGVALSGVYTFRDLDDAQRLAARRLRSRRTVVIGGGLLGLEAARAMQRFNTHVLVVEHATHLMFNQLDVEGGQRLREHVESMGIEVITDDSVAAIEGEHRVDGLRLRSGDVIECDTVILATGIRPRTELALDAGLGIGRGVRVDDQLRTSDEFIFAVGECAEHRGTVYGLVAPGLEQAAVAAAAIDGRKAQYVGSINATRLKVLDLPVFSAGSIQDEGPDVRTLTFVEGGGVYRRLFLRHGRLAGALGLGDWPEARRIQDLIRKRARLPFWVLRRFGKIGWLSSDTEAADVASWPETALVCNCRAVSRGDLGKVMTSGCASVECLTQRTGAGGVCGSCRPLLAELLGAASRLEPVRLWGALLGAGLVGLVFLTLQYVLPSPAFVDSVQHSVQLREWLSDDLVRQVTGFTLAGLTLLVVLMSARKRMSWFKWGDFSGWRLLHVVASVLALGMVLVHTSANMGQGLNAWLLGLYLASAGLGAVLALQIAVEQRLKPKVARTARSALLWTHVLVVWPLPLLLVAHIVKAYWF